MPRQVTLRRLTPTLGKPSCPTHVKGEARKEFNRVCDELDTMGLLATADRGIIAQYALAWATSRKAAQHIDEEGEVLTSLRTGQGYQSPWVGIYNTADSRLTKYMSELCLTPLSRSRVKVQVEVEASQSSDLIDVD
jgi:P27 family predicted phage terminase small subunit